MLALVWIATHMKRALLLLLPSLGLIAAACSTPSGEKLVSDPALFEKSELSFIRAGATSRDEIIFRLGSPSSTFESDRILIYQVGFESSGKAHLYAPRILRAEQKYSIRDWERGTFSLVLVFGPDGLLSKHSLVPSE
jgi:hypothetical protein